MFSTQPSLRSTMDANPRRGRLRALALLIAAIAILGGLVPSSPAMAADLGAGLGARYPWFVELSGFVAGDTTTVRDYTFTGTGPSGQVVTFGCTAVVRCTLSPAVPQVGTWSFDFTGTGLADRLDQTVVVKSWTPSFTVTPAAVTLNLPVNSDGANLAHTYEFTPVGGGASITGATQDSSKVIASSSFVPGTEYNVTATVAPIDSNYLGTSPSIPVSGTYFAPYSAPTTLTAKPRADSVDLNWSLPAATPTPSATGVYWRKTGTTLWSPVTVSAGNSHTVTGLESGASYDFYVSTMRDGLDDGMSPIVTATPMALPAAPVLGAITPRSGAASVMASFPTSTIAPSAAVDAVWEVAATRDDPLQFTTAATSIGADGSTLILGLTNGIEYVARVQSVNASGESDWVTSGTVRPLDVPGAPLVADVVAGDGSATLSVTFPSSEEAPAAAQVWEVSVLESGVAADWKPALPQASGGNHYILSGLTNGLEYRVRVSSTGTAGASATTESISFRPFGAAPVPTITSIGRGDGTVSAAASFNTSAAQPSESSDAIWQLKTAGGIISGTDLTLAAIDGRFVFSGLTNGSAYQIRVRGSNDHGESDWTAWSDFVTPATAPGALTLTPGGMSDGALTVTFPVASAAAPVTSIVWQIGTVDENGNVSWAPAVPVIDGTTASFAGLVPGTTYEVKATPSNDVGSGPDSVSGAQLFIGVPNKPVILIAGAQKTGLLVALEPAFADTAKPTVGYVWEVARVAGPAAGIWEPVGASVLDRFVIDNEGSKVPVLGGYAITGLIDGVRYNLHVAAINGAGRSAWAAWNPQLTPASGIITGTIPAADNTTVAGDDSDSDGLPNAIDPDVDGDSVPNPFDPDIDGAGIANLDDDDRDGDDLINPLDDTPNGIGSASDHADDWIDPVIPTTVTTAGVSTDTGAASPASGTTNSSAPVASFEGDVATVLSVRFPYPVGHQARGMTVYSAGRGLMPGSEYALVLHSKPTTLGHGSVNSSGTIQFTATMPSSLSAGKHELVLTAVSASGKTVTKTLALRVGKDGMLRPVHVTSSSGSSGGSAGVEILHEDNSLRMALIVGAVILWLLILAAAIWAAIILRRRRRDDDDEPEDETLDLFDESVGTR